MSKQVKETALQKAMGRIKVKVVKGEPDGRMSLCGEPMLSREVQDPITKEKTIEEYFIIPADRGEYITKMFPHYGVSDSYEETEVAKKARLEASEQAKQSRYNRHAEELATKQDTGE